MAISKKRKYNNNTEHRTKMNNIETSSVGFIINVLKAECKVKRIQTEIREIKRHPPAD